MSEIALVVTAFALTCLATALIITLTQIRRSLIEATQALAAFRREVPPVIHELRETLSQASSLIEQVRQGVGRADMLFESMEGVGRALRNAQEVVTAFVGRRLKSFFTPTHHDDGTPDL